MQEIIMELKYLELDQKLLLVPDGPLDENEALVARVSEMMERVENIEAGIVVLSTSGSFTE
jgi:stalled ribosome rescue protein Dom34